ncbi:TraR/DksA family transcriptional regulator [Actinomadura rupiterrae]|uniref:TraR/DksA family transcriptional regulator n=1 Tax=Actinomadura rupiterrae TaxID=559627 RepID=UPI0020A26A1B|nr:TraR/DksA C4-type zinc finger protein [Actinomadura rupiterrae]MCP2342221.1 RNA polymerase-binding transcription factor DksA [Actinomadura rupiterrae]
MDGRRQDFNEAASARERLNGDRIDAQRLIAALSADWDGVVEASAQANSDDEHDPEGATIAFERARVQASLTRARAQLADIEDALRRLDIGTYGTCEQCGGPIAPDRLAARPAARTCFRCAST